LNSRRLGTLRKIVERNDTAAGRVFDLFIQVLILLSLVSFSIETLPDLSTSTRILLGRLEVITVLIFTAEYLLRLVVADKKLKFVFSFYGLIDLVAIAPFYFTTGVDLRSVRIFRLFRLFRTLKILRHSTALRRFRTAFCMIRTELLMFLTATVFLLFVSAVGIYYFENEAQPEVYKSIFHAMWWSAATLTTVGYGDIYPVTVGGKVFTFLMLMVGLGVVAVPTGLISSAMTKAIADVHQGKSEA
jgi:voltage-gated potassium channel